ncbi:MAG: alpha/beta fold hydrolase [Methylocystaceae bacterium]|nr:alpha/beta fold hydrolase [Methylocystaceae bacterium]
MPSGWYRKGDGRTTVVFVHGINSSADGFRSSSAFWPDLLAKDEDLDGLGIYSFEYRSGITASKYSLGDAVDLLAHALKFDDLLSCQRLIFVCHSMGGNLVRRLLISRVTEFSRRQIEIGLFLIASPSIGSHYANLIGLVSGKYNLQLDSLKFSQDNTWLIDLDKDFRSLIASPPFKIFGKELIEDLPIKPGRFLPKLQVVPYHSAARYFGEPIKIPGSDHSSISKPDSRDADQHKILIQFIKENSTPLKGNSTAQHRTIAENFLERLDRNDPSGAWELMDPLAIGVVVADLEEFLELFENVRGPLGSRISRSFAGTNGAVDPSGYPSGRYQTIIFRTEFAECGKLAENVTVRALWNGDWRVFGYLITDDKLAP